MKRTVIAIGLALIIAHILPELGEIFERVGWLDIYVNPFLDPGYVFPVHTGQPSGIRLVWFIYYMGNDLLLVVAHFAAAHIAAKYSYKLFLIFGIYFTYHLFDHIMLWWNFKSSSELYWIIHAVNITSILILIFKKEKQQAVVRSMV